MPAEEDMSALEAALNSDDDKAIAKLADEGDEENIQIIDDEGHSDEAAPKVEKEELEAKPQPEPEPEPEPAPQPKPSEDRKRHYTGHLPAQRQELIRLLAENPDMSEEDALKLVKKDGEHASNADEEEAKGLQEEIASDKEKLETVRGQLAEFDEKWDHTSQEYKDAKKLEGDLVLRIAENTARNEVATVSAKQREKEAEQDFDSAFADSESKAVALIPALADEYSFEFQVVAGRVEQLFKIMEAGKELPKVTVDGVEKTLDPRSSEFPILVAYEQAPRFAKQAPEAKPGAKVANPSSKRPVTPISKGGAASVAHHRPVEGQETSSAKERLAKVSTMEDLNAALDDDDEPIGSWKTRSQVIA